MSNPPRTSSTPPNSKPGTTPSTSGRGRWPVGLNRQVLLLGLVSMFADVASEMLVPITPIFLTAVLGTSAANLGLIEGTAEAIASLMKTFSGAWSDRIRKRRPFIVFGYLAAALSKPLIGMSHSWEQVLGARSLDRFGKGVRGAPRDALLSDSVPEAESGAAFGWHRALDTTGAVVGPLLALGLMAVFADNLREVYYFALIPGLLSVALAWTLKEAAPVAGGTEKAAARAKSAQDGKNAGARVENRIGAPFVGFLVAWGAFCLVNSSDAFLILRAKNLGYTNTQTILVYCLYNVIYAAASPYLGGLGDRIGKKLVLGGGLVAFALVYFGFAVVSSAWVLIALFAAYGLYAAATDGIGKALAVELISKDAKGYGLGLLGAETGILALVASVVAGLLWDKVGPSATFYYGAAGAIIAAILVFLLPAKRSTAREAA